MRFYLVIVLSLSALFGCQNGDCRTQIDDVPLVAAWYDGSVLLAHEPPFLQVDQTEIYWTLPTDATSLQVTMALSDLATAETIVRTSVSELDLQDRISTSEPYVAEGTLTLQPDEIVTFDAPLSVAPRPKSFYIAHEGPGPLRIFRLSVERLVCS